MKPWERRPVRCAISKKLRFEVLKRDGFRCVYCGTPASSGVALVLDHVQPVVEGGANEASNLVTCCEPCNQGKGCRPLGLAERLAHLPAAARPVVVYRDGDGIYLPRSSDFGPLTAASVHDLLHHLFDRPQGSGLFRFGGLTVDFREGKPPRAEWADPEGGVM